MVLTHVYDVRPSTFTHACQGRWTIKNVDVVNSCMQSYFGGVCCVSWSPDGRYIAAGGEDDLVSIYGLAERGLVAWGQGHSSWVMQIAFDPW